MKRVSAFTLVELLVVIAIIGILVALLLPAIQASRESARRAQCTNQIAQLILAVHGYEAAHEVFPMGTIEGQGPIKNLPIGHHISWIARILPYIEERPLYDSIDPSLSAYHQRNDRARQITMSLLICPSCPANDWPYTCYAGCHHDAEAPIDTTNNGVMFLNSHITRDDLKDGASHTLFLGEKGPDNFDLGWLSGTPSTLRNVGTPLNFVPRRMWALNGVPWVYGYPPSDSQWQWSNQQIDPTTGVVVPAGQVGSAPPTADPATTTTPETPTPDATAKESSQADAATTEAPPKSTDQVATAAPTATAPAANTTPDAELIPDRNGFLPHSKLGGNTTAPLAVGGFSSSHSGGVNFAFGDGSVRFVNDNASPGLLGRLANRADGQPIDAKEW